MKKIDISTLNQTADTIDDKDLVLCCTSCDKQFDVGDFLRQYGPEGCYILANRLKAAADADINNAMSETWATD